MSTKQDNLHFNAQERLKNGIAKVAKAVGGTMGTGGSNSIIEAIEAPGYLATNDGYSIANAIHFSDPIEDLGRKMLLESINRANKASGDGSSTTCVTTASIIEEGLAYLEKEDAHPMDVKRDLENALKTIEESLDAQTEHIVTDGQINIERLKQVASISAEDEQIGGTIAEIYNQIGKDGLVYWDISKTGEDYYTIGSGITVDDATYVSPYLCDATETGQNTNQIKLKNPKILITKQKITSAGDFENIAGTLYRDEVKDLVVFVDEIDPLVVPDLIKTRIVQGFRLAVIKMPVLWKDWWYEDLSKATGATVIDPTAGLSMKDVTKEHLGTAGHILVTKDSTHLDGIKDVSEHIAELQAEGTEDSELRVARLNTKTARYYVGAQSESALSYRRLKVEDAIAAAHHALNGGVVVGGGVALYNASKLTDNPILRTALQTPLKTIIENAGGELSDEIGGHMGFNSRTRQVEDLFEQGIVDPRNIVLNAVKNAVSVAATVITAPTIVSLPIFTGEKV